MVTVAHEWDQDMEIMRPCGQCIAKKAGIQTLSSVLICVPTAISYLCTIENGCCPPGPGQKRKCSLVRAHLGENHLRINRPVLTTMLSGLVLFRRLFMLESQVCFCFLACLQQTLSVSICCSSLELLYGEPLPKSSSQRQPFSMSGTTGLCDYTLKVINLCSRATKSSNPYTTTMRCIHRQTKQLPFLTQDSGHVCLCRCEEAR